MEHTHTMHAENHGGGKKEIWKITGILTVLTLVELVLGFWMIGMPLEEHGKRLATKVVIIILMVAKAFYITAYFMHLKHELRNMIMTIVVPLSLFIWFIIAFLSDGNSFKNLRTTYDAHFREQKDIKMVVKEHGEGKHEESKEHKSTEQNHEEMKAAPKEEHSTQH